VSRLAAPLLAEQLNTTCKLLAERYQSSQVFRQLLPASPARAKLRGHDTNFHDAF
jgi:hypothetical protein